MATLLSGFYIFIILYFSNASLNCDFYKSKRAVTNSSMILKFMNPTELISFKRRKEICSFCFNGTLVTGQEINHLKDETARTLIGAQHLAGSDHWTWLNGSAVGDFEEYSPDLELVESRGLSPDLTYGLLMVSGELISVVEDQTLPRKYPIETVCQHPYRTQCIRWEIPIEDNWCRHQKEFSCHKYLTLRQQDADEPGASGKCTGPPITRLAIHCIPSECKCEVSKWSAWLDENCSLATCYSKETRTRSRHYIKACHDDSVSFALVEKEECKVEGCENFKVENITTLAPEEQNTSN